MSKKAILNNHKKLENSIEELIRYGIDIIFNKELMEFGNTEKNILIESLLLRGCAHWESFIETEIIYLINLNSENFKSYMELASNTKLNLKLIRAILYGDRYLDFHDIAKNKSYFSKILYEKYNPFSEIKKEQVDKINITYAIRNYISHQSNFSKKKLSRIYKKHYKYMVFQEPGRFLIKENGKYFENLIHNFTLISLTIRKFLGVKDE